MMKSIFYIQGYKVDNQKIRRILPRRENHSEETYHFSWRRSIIDLIPETAYKYVGCGVEPDGELNLVLVLYDGYNVAKMKKRTIKPRKTLPEQALQFLTPGIWPCRDHLETDVSIACCIVALAVSCVFV
jgi:hypothetical protein